MFSGRSILQKGSKGRSVLVSWLKRCYVGQNVIFKDNDFLIITGIKSTLERQLVVTNYLGRCILESSRAVYANFVFCLLCSPDMPGKTTSTSMFKHNVELLFYMFISQLTTVTACMPIFALEFFRSW